jgi:hypothetical protein
MEGLVPLLEAPVLSRRIHANPNTGDDFPVDQATAD